MNFVSFRTAIKKTATKIFEKNLPSFICKTRVHDSHSYHSNTQTERRFATSNRIWRRIIHTQIRANGVPRGSTKVEN